MGVRMSRSVSSAFIGGLSLALILGAGVVGAPAALASSCSATPVASGTGLATIFTETHTAVGTCDWTPPTGVVSVDVLLVSGGGGGGGGELTSGGGGGGGGAGEAKAVAGINVLGTPPFAVTVGDGGLGGPSGLDGLQGGQSFFSGRSAEPGGYGQTSTTATGGGRGGDSTPRIGGGGAGAGQGGGGSGAGQGGNGTAATSANGANGIAAAIATGLAGSLFAGWADVYGASGGGGASGSATRGLGGSGGGGDGGSSSAGSIGSPNTGAGGGGGGSANAGGKGGSGLVIIRYQVAAISPATLTINATVGQAITPTTFALYGVGATQRNQWCDSTPGTYDNVSAYELVPGITLDESTCGLSGTPTATASTASFVIGGGGAVTVPAGGKSTVTITVSASGGGGSGGGGNSSSTTDSPPAPTSTPSPTPTPTVSTPPTPVLEPVIPGSNTNIPAAGVPLGASVYLVNGQPQTVVVKPDAPKAATAIDVVGDGFTMKLAGLGADGQPLGVTSDGALILQQDRTAAVEGTGFKPNSDVELYAFSTQRFLGSVKTDASGNFKGTVPLPMDIPAGRHTLQSNGFAPDGAVRSLSLGVLLSTDKAPVKAKVARATVFFDALSARLSSTAKASLKALVKGRGASATRSVVVGYVQPAGTSSNDKALSTQRAKTIAAYLRSLGLKGTVTTRGDGVAKETGAAGRKAVIAIRYVR